MTQERKPDWEWWGNICDLTILEAVALSMDIDPNDINYRTHRKPYGEEVTKRDESPEFEKRLALAFRNLDTLSARNREDADKLEYCYWVEQAKFTAVALSWNWKIPPELAALAEPDKRDAEILSLKQHVEALTKERDSWESEAAKVQKQLNAGRDHYSEKLVTLTRAATTFWANADPHDRQTHRENPEVIAWLMKNGYSSILAKKGATIIRPKWAPIGRKPKE